MKNGSCVSCSRGWTESYVWLYIVVWWKALEDLGSKGWTKSPFLKHHPRFPLPHGSLIPASTVLCALRLTYCWYNLTEPYSTKTWCSFLPWSFPHNLEVLEQHTAPTHAKSRSEAMLISLGVALWQVADGRKWINSSPFSLSQIIQRYITYASQLFLWDQTTSQV
jgi:hypothetical protein